MEECIMPSFGKRSTENLNNLNKNLQDILNEVIKYYDFSILSSYRGEMEQNELHHKGFSKLKFPYSKHNTLPSNAVDVAPYPIDWKDTRRFDILAGHIMMAADMKDIKIKWGGDWNSDDDLKDQSFNDLGHFELIT